MTKNWLKMVNNLAQYIEESIQLRDYHSSEDLKNEIGQRIQNRREANWDFVEFTSKGAFLYLTFKQELN